MESLEVGCLWAATCALPPPPACKSCWLIISSACKWGVNVTSYLWSLTPNQQYSTLFHPLISWGINKNVTETWNALQNAPPVTTVLLPLLQSPSLPAFPSMDCWWLVSTPPRQSRRPPSLLQLPLALVRHQYYCHSTPSSSVQPHTVRFGPTL